MMATVKRLETEHVSTYYDPDSRIAFITYHIEVNPMSTKLAYEWIGTSAPIIGIENIRGGIFDFRHVTCFAGYSLSVVRQERQKIQAKQKFCHIPTALIVNSPLQEQMVYTSLKITEQSERFKVVKDMESALAFIDAWHQYHV